MKQGMWLLIILSLGVIGWGGWWLYMHRQAVPKQVNQVVDIPRPLDKYTIENLGKREYKSQIVIDDEVSPGVFNFHFDSDGKKVTGLAHMPKKCPCPVIVQFRGYVDKEIYKPGVGTKRTAEVFAKNGFISLAPDFLGYGGSDNPSDDVFEERFQSYTTALNLLAGIEVWDKAGKIGIWGHSNGGQIALTVLEISQKNYPTVLWAPVSKPFPYSILYYTDEAEDKGKLLRKKLAKFEEDYDVNLYDPMSYLDRIVAKVQVHQGTGDDAVNYKWSRDLIKKIGATYFEYPGADHNLLGGWDVVVRRSIDFWGAHW